MNAICSVLLSEHSVVYIRCYSIYHSFTFQNLHCLCDFLHNTGTSCNLDWELAKG